jgi:hypothetical protein
MPAPAIGLQPRVAPPIHAAVNYSHPLTAGMVGAWRPVSGNPSGIGAIDVVGGQHMTTAAAGPSLSAGAWGEEWRADADNEGMTVTTGTAGPSSLQPPLTLAWVGTKYSGEEQDAPFFGVLYNTAGDNPFCCYNFYWEGGGHNLGFEWNASGSYDFVDTGAALTNGPHVVVATMLPSGAGGIVVYRDGLSVATDTGFATINYAASSFVTFHVPWSISNLTAAVGSVLGVIWRRALSAGEVGMFTADPFCFLRR